MTSSRFDRYKQIADDPSRMDEAVELLRGAVGEGTSGAANELADILTRRGAPGDVDEAVTICRAGMDTGNLWSQGRMARYYRDGTGVDADLDKAIELMTAPAEARIRWAVLDMENMLLTRGSDDDMKALFRLYMIGSFEGDVWSRIKAARFCSSGTGTTRDLVMARALYKSVSDVSDVAKHELAMMPKSRIPN